MDRYEHKFFLEPTSDLHNQDATEGQNRFFKKLNFSLNFYLLPESRPDSREHGNETTKDPTSKAVADGYESLVMVFD
jgi:hypothetical protein